MLVWTALWRALFIIQTVTESQPSVVDSWIRHCSVDGSCSEPPYWRAVVAVMQLVQKGWTVGGVHSLVKRGLWVILVSETTQSLTLVKRLLFGLGVCTLVLFAQKPKGVHGTAVDISHSSKKCFPQTSYFNIYYSFSIFPTFTIELESFMLKWRPLLEIKWQYSTQGEKCPGAFFSVVTSSVQQGESGRSFPNSVWHTGGCWEEVEREEEEKEEGEDDASRGCRDANSIDSQTSNDRSRMLAAGRGRRAHAQRGRGRLLLTGTRDKLSCSGASWLANSWWG